MGRYEFDSGDLPHLNEATSDHKRVPVVSLSQALHEAEAAKVQLLDAMEKYMIQVQPLLEQSMRLAEQFGMLSAPAPTRPALSATQEWGTRLARDRRAFVHLVPDRAAAAAKVEALEQARDIVTRYAVAATTADGSTDYTYTRWTTDPKDAS